MAPSITAVTASPGMPNAMMVTSEPPTLALLEASEAMMPSGCAGAEPLRRLGEFLRLVVGQHAGGAAADRRQHADDDADDRRPEQQERPAEDLADHLEMRHETVERCGSGAAPAAPDRPSFSTSVMICAKAKMPIRTGRNGKPPPMNSEPKVKRGIAADRVGADHRDEQADARSRSAP